MRIKTYHSKQLQVISLTVLYLFISLTVVFFLPKGAHRFFAHQHQLDKPAQVYNGYYKNFLRRTDKIVSFGRKQFIAIERNTLLLSADAAPRVKSGIQSPAFRFYLKLKSVQQSQPGYVLNCCWRI